jgi:hypothetical protein
VPGTAWAVEINAHPWRLDLDWRCPQAACINSDRRHGPRTRTHGLGVEMARKAGVPGERVPNTLPLTSSIGAVCEGCLFSRASVRQVSASASPRSVLARHGNVHILGTLQRPAHILKSFSKLSRLYTALRFFP